MPDKVTFESALDKVDKVPDDMQRIREIASRAREVVERHGGELDTDECEMDLIAVHGGHTPLRLDDLLNADDFNLLHDVGGIRDHLNRDTCELEHFFRPRFAARK